MKASELRKGNWVQTKQTKKQFKINYNHFAETHIITNNYEPIPLTEEWLLKFGFMYRKHLDDYYIEIGKQGTILIFENITSYLCNPNRERQFLCNLEYVHQLQNLFFALTGEELKLKEI